MVAALLVVLAVNVLRGDGTQVQVGQPFSAASPWRLEVEGSRCDVTVAEVGPGQPERRAYGSDLSLQMRQTGLFVVKALTPGCTAAVQADAGDTWPLPFTMESGKAGAGGDSHPFHSDGALMVSVSGTSCRATVHDANNGSEVAALNEHDQSAPVDRTGMLYLSSDFQCSIKVSGGDRQGG